MQPEFCSREKLLHYFKRQLNEKPTSNDPSYTCTNSQYLSHITSIDLMILTLAMAALQKQMWGHRPQHSPTQLNNNYTGLYTYWSNEPSAWYARSWSYHINKFTYLYQQWVNGSLLKGTTTLPCHLITSICPEQMHFMDYKNTSLGKATLKQFLSHSDQPHRSLWP